MCATRSAARTGFSPARWPSCCKRAGSRQGQARRPVRVELHAGARHRGRPDAASRTDACAGSITFRWAAPAASSRCAARRARCNRGDADAVACIAGDTNHTDSFRLNLATFSQFARDAVYPYGSGGANASFAFLTAYYMRTYGATREDFGKICVAQRANALKFPLRADEEAADARRISRRARRSPIRCASTIASCRAPAPTRFWCCAAARPRSSACPMRASWRRSSGTMPFPTIRSSIAAAGRSIATSFTRRPESARRTSTCSRPTTTIRSSRMMQIEDLGFCNKGEGAGFRPPRTASPPTARFRSTPRAGNCRSARPARPAAFSVWSRSSAK